MLRTYVVVERIPRLFSLRCLSLEEKAVENAVVEENVAFWVFLGAQKYLCWVGGSLNSSTQDFHLIVSKPFYAKTKVKMLVVPEITKRNAKKKKKPNKKNQKKTNPKPMFPWPCRQGKLSGCGIGMQMCLAKIYCSTVQIL